MKKLPNDPGAVAGHQADLALARAAASGDERARRQLVDRLMDRVRNTVYYMAAGRSDSEDLAQLTFIQLFKSIGSFRGQSSLESWAARITARTVMREIRKARTYQSRFMDSASADVELVADLRVDDEANDQRLSQRIAALLAELKPKHRQTLVLRLVEEYDLKEIAEAMDTNVYTVRYRLRVGRKKLARLVRRDPQLSGWLGGGGR